MRGSVITKLLLWIVGIVLMGLVLAWLAGAFKTKVEPGVAKAPESVAPRMAAVQPVTESNEQVIERVPGTLSAIRETMISPRIMATIGEINVGAGDRVERGQVLARLDSRDLAAREQQAKEAVNSARAKLSEAEKEYNRMKSLVDKSIIPRSQFDTAEAAYKTARAEVQRTEQAVGEAQAGSSYAVIEAPFGGRIVDKYAEPGDTATPGTPILKLYDPTRMRLEAYVRESLAGRLRPGTDLAVMIDALTTTVQGRVEEIVPQAEPGSRSMLVKVSLPERGDIYPGMFGRLLIPTGREKRIYAPEKAILRVGQLTYVWVDRGKNQFERRFVTLGESRRDGQREILSGLAPGERVGVPAV
ncbi:efflux RND transporter periplasmic adaptor subunit [bacterium]|nr:efflux RND transporter periplasmic adaptor subunit [bacterium]